MKEKDYTINLTSLADFGATGATLTYQTGGAATLRLEIDALIDAADVFSPFQKVELRSPTGTTLFTGWCDEAPRRATAGSERTTFVFTGPMRWLTRTPYLDEENLIRWGGMVLGWKPIDGEDARESIAEQIGRVATYANAQGASLGDFPSGPGALMTPLERFGNISCAAAVSSIARWTPAVALVATGAGSLIWRDTLADGTTVHSALALIDDATAIDLNPHYDLLRSTITLRFLRPYGSGTGFVAETDSATGGEAETLGADREEVVTIEDLLAHNGLAAEYHRWVSKLQISCSLSAQALHWEIEPGHRLAFAGLLSRWSDYDAVIQTIERDLFSETIRITTGPRSHLGLDSLLELARRSIKSNASGGGGGGGGDDDEPSGKHVTDVTWDADLGVLVVHFSDETTTPIPFSGCS